MIYPIQGRVVHNSGMQTKNKFSFVEIALDISEGKYEDYALLQGSGNLIGPCCALKAGDVIDATFSVAGRRWQSPSGEVKFFNSLRLVHLTVVERAEVHTSNSPILNETTTDDLPF